MSWLEFQTSTRWSTIRAKARPNSDEMYGSWGLCMGVCHHGCGSLAIFVGGGRFSPQQHPGQDGHAGGKRARSEDKANEPEEGPQDDEADGEVEDLDEDTKEFLELVCEEEDWERLRRTGSLKKEEPETRDDSEETSYEEPLPPNETLEQFLDLVVPHVDEDNKSGKEEREGSSQRGRSSCRTGGDPGGSEPEDEEPEDDADTSEDEGESVFSTYSRRSRDLDVEESQRRDPGRDLIIRPRGDWSPGLLEGDYKQAIQMGESSCRATEEVVCAAAE